MSSKYAEKCNSALVDLQRFSCGHYPIPAMGRQSPDAALTLYTPPVFERPPFFIYGTAPVLLYSS